jgi:DNA-binding NarL/FixJ family response regulator
MEVSRSLAMDLPRGHLVVLEGSQPNLLVEGTEGMIKLLPDFFCDGVVSSQVATSSAEALPASGRQGVPVGTLSRREIEFLRLLAAGESNAQIARRLGISAYTIERHVVNVYRKIEARGRADAMAYALRHGLG